MRCVNCGWDNQPNQTTCEKCGMPLSTYGEVSPSGGYQQNPYPSGNLSGGAGSRPTVLNSGGVAPVPRPTRMMRAGEGEPQQRATVLQKSRSCPRCGYLVMGDSSSCPNCGTAFDSQAEPLRSEASKKTKWAGANQKVKCQKCGTEVGLDFLFCPHCGERIRQQTIAVWHHRKQESPLPKCSLTIMLEDDEKLEKVTHEYEGDAIMLNRDNTEEYNRTITSGKQAELTYEDGKWYIMNHSELESTLILVTRKRELLPGDIVVLGDRRFRFDAEQQESGQSDY